MPDVDLNPVTLRVLRERSGFSQSELARRTNGLITQGHISLLESGDRKASPKTVKVLAEALGCPVAALVTGLTHERAQEPA